MVTVNGLELDVCIYYFSGYCEWFKIVCMYILL